VLLVLYERWEKYNFLFKELVKRDFNKRYKRTIFGILWSLLSPLLQLAIMALIFTTFFGDITPHFIVYIFSGKLIYIFFSQATSSGMMSLVNNSGIISSMKTPKYIFLLSQNVSALINFFMTLVVYFIFVAGDGIAFHPRFFMLIFPIVCLVAFNIGVGLFLSAMYVFFKDTQYLYDIFLMLLMWLSAIFYPVEQFPHRVQQMFLLNPIFTYIHYFRLIVLHGVVPSATIHLLAMFYALAALAVGGFIYKRYSYRFIFYM